MKNRAGPHPRRPNERLDFVRFLGKIPTMTITADAKKRVRLGLAKPGDRFDVQVTGDGAFILRRLEPVKENLSQSRLVKEGKFLVIETDGPLDMDAVKQLTAEFP
jgi:bifunctional DNA-binding transcriptional regulator/antitoxin component of YhaV-PrlF toxin-antitoxin module